MKLTEKELQELVVGGGFATDREFRDALAFAKEKEISPEEALIQANILSDENLGRIIAERRGYKFVDLSKQSIDLEALRIIPELVAKSKETIAFERTKEGLKIATSHPDDLEFANWLSKKTGENILVHFTTPYSLKESLKYYRHELKEEFGVLLERYLEEAEKRGEGGEEIETPIIKMVDTLLAYAYENRASDIHLEPREKTVVTRFRIDGILHNVITSPKQIHEKIVSRIKVLAKLRTDEHMAAQDGRFAVKREREEFDVRVSIIPITKGEKVVMRLLAEHSRAYSLEELGFRGKDLAKVEAAAEKPFGMILSTGPTGSGKTTTLYAILKILNKPEVNISTIEDPVEYDIEGVNQIQVNAKKGITFAKGLRAIVRQDPNIIMVGEIRDEETADIAINSAMTGHLVLSTLHTVDAATSLPRLIDMKIESFLIASAVNVVIAQRLIRKICLQCIESYEISEREVDLIKRDPAVQELLRTVTGEAEGDIRKLRLYHGQGCKTCGGIGYSGRTGIFEVLEINDPVRELIMAKADASRIDTEAKKRGMTSMFYDGLEKVLKGVTTLDELLRVMRE